MNTSELTYEHVGAELLLCVPELKEQVQRAFGADYQMDEESPGQYPIFEDVVQECLFKVLDSEQDEAFLRRLFMFFERMANSNDRNVVDLLRIAILEPLVYRSTSYRHAQCYMGKKTAEFALLEEGEQKAAKKNISGPSTER